MSGRASALGRAQPQTEPFGPLHPTSPSPQKWIGLGQQDQNVPLAPAVPFIPCSLSLSVRGSSLKCVTRGLGLNLQASWVVVQGPLAPTEVGLGALTPGTSPVMREEASPTCLTEPRGPCSSAAEELLGWSRLSRQHHSWPFTTPDPQGSRKESRGRNSSNLTFLMTHRGVSLHLLSFSGKPDLCPFPGPQHLPPMPPAPSLSPSEVHTPLQALRVHCLWIPSQPPVQFSHP